MVKEQKAKAKPFLKWAGGKKQLLNELEKRIPLFIKEKKVINHYIEPFVGGGAFFFKLINNYKIKKSTLIDINRELIVGYKAIQQDHVPLIDELHMIQEEYISLNEEYRKQYYYDIRNKYNKNIDNFNYDTYDDNWVIRASQLIFLNKTCFNGLFRQNKKGEFNVPIGAHNNPMICDEQNLQQVHKSLSKATIMQGDFNLSLSKRIVSNTFVYLDPPYRPLSATSSFTSYAKEGFDDSDQTRLKEYYDIMYNKGAYLLLSNSDPKNTSPDDNFFEKLYGKYKIETVEASRSINCNGNGRGKIRELIITSNYDFGDGNPKYQNGISSKK